MDVRLNHKGETGNLALTSTCTWEEDEQATHSPAQYSFTVKGCASGDTNIRLYKANTDVLLAVYPINVISLATAPPSAVGSTTAQTVVVGAETRTDMATMFSGIVERYTAASSEDSVATAAMSGSTLVITGVKAGSASVTVTATNPRGSIKRIYSVTVNSALTTAPTASGTPAIQSVNVNATTIVDVSGDFSGTGLSYSASSSDATKATASIPASSSTMTITGVAAGTATITVTATNSAGTATQTYSVTVTAAATTPTAGGPTVPTGGPSVNAGADQTVTTGASVSLFGTGSPVDDDDDASYSWTQQSGTTVSLTSPITGLPYTAGLSGNSARFTAPSTAGTLVFWLTVTDAGTGLSSWDEVTITVS